MIKKQPLHSEKRITEIWKIHVSLAIVLMAFYLLSLVLRPLNVPDEGRYPSIALAMLQRHDFVSTMLNGGVFMDKPVLYYWLEAFSMWIFGVNEWSIRLPSALAGIWGALLTQHIAFKFFDKKTAILSGFILGTSILYYISANYADMDLEVAVWIVSALFFSLSGLQCSQGRKRRFYFYMAYIFAAAAFLTKGLMGIVFPAMVLGIYSVTTKQWSLIKKIYLPTGLLLFFILSAPWYILMQKSHPGFFNYFFIYQQFIRFSQSGFNSVAPFWFYIPVVFFGLFPWTFFTLKAAKSVFLSHWRTGPHAFLAIWIVSIFIFFSIPGSKPVTYILPVFPPLAILLGHEIKKWMNEAAFKKTTTVSGIIFTIALGTVSLIAGIAPDYFPGNIPASAQPPLVSIAVVIFVISVVISGCTLKRNKKGIVFTSFSGLVLLLVLANVVSGKFNYMSTKKLASYIQKKNMPDVQIINYKQYFYDLPLYLHTGKPVIVVDNWNNRHEMLSGDNWRRELYYGMEGVPRAKAWLITPDKFDQALKKPSWIFARTGYAKHLVKNHGLSLIAQSGKVALLSNMDKQFSQ